MNRLGIRPPGVLSCLLFILTGLLGTIVLPDANGQITKIRGEVTDAQTGEVLPFVNISFTGKPIGTITDFNGEYYLETDDPADSIRISYLGYRTQYHGVHKHIFQTINIQLQPDQFRIDEVVVHRGENPAHPILRNIIANKVRNNPLNLNSFHYETYNKIQIDVNNVDEDFREQPVLKPFQFVFDHMDTSAITGKSYLPVMLSEAISDYYYTRDPKNEKEIIRASKVSGIDNESLSQVTGNIFQDLNIYDNFLKVFNQGFISPIADFGLFYYKYYLVDSAYLNDCWCYELSFRPRREKEPTFTGDFWVHDTTFAIVKIRLRLESDVNVNFVNDIAAEEEYRMINDTMWFVEKQTLFLDFYLRDQATGFFGRKTTTYDKIRINEPFPPEAVKLKDKVKVSQDALDRGEKFWRENRPVTLTNKESNIYDMVDSIQTLPEYVFLENLIEMFVTGYYVKGYLEIGPYYTFYSYNEIEGKRIRLGGRTSNAFSTSLMVGGYGAYGLKDKRFKYGTDFLYLFSKNPRIAIGGSFTHDIEQIGESPYAFKNDNFFVSYLRRNPNYKLTLADHLNLYFEKEWIQGFSNTLTFSHKRIYATEFIPFLIPSDTMYIPASVIKNSEIVLNTRYAKGERYIMGEFLRTSIGTRHPVLNIDLSLGLKHLIGSEYNYLKLKFSITQKVQIHPIGYFRYRFDGGKIFGTLPYPLLHLHEGNETYIFDMYSFNMMNYYEFASDQYLGLFVEHHFQGLFLNKVPLLRKLNWREVITARGVIGSLDPKHEKLMAFPEGLTNLDKPYMETGVGIENILKFLRVDAMWRLTHRNHSNIEKFGIRIKLQFIF
ncbi:MAG: carboxypeptidase-like regulatory domain-containing protein [Bacteroidales bacterium]|nr:MAG: carboxypeptidase-like regulatory domain-containing protein [Bacteroidales bacterium]